MRIQTVTLRNYRIHRELTVAFDPARTLVGGPNESGKSTLVEAVHRSLFLKAKGNTENHRAMQSALHTGQPEVELVFEAGGREYQLKKRFGTNGSTTLTSSNAAPLLGDAADEELARIISVEQGAAGKAMLAQWAHLWVWQGRAGDDPSAHANAQRDALFQRLQGNGVAAALRSELDARVAGLFAAAAATVYTQAGKAKAGSELEKAESAADQADAELTRAEERFQRLQSAATEVAAATREIPRVEESLRRLEKDKADLEARESELATLRQKETEQKLAVTSAMQAYDRLNDVGKSIRDKRGEVRRLEQELAPKQTRIAELAKTRESTRVEAEKAEKDYRTATEAVRTARLRRDLAAAWRRSFETEEQHAELAAKLIKVTELRGKLAGAKTELAKLPHVEKNTLNKLQELEKARTTARVALEAMAAGLEIITASQPVRACDETLAVGRKLILTEDTEVTVGDGTRFRVTPGGGTSLANARKAATDAESEFQRQLNSLGLTSLQEASDTVERREAINGQIKTTNAELGAWGAGALENDLSKAHTDWTAAKADVNRLAAQVVDAPVPQDTGQAETLEKKLRDELDTFGNAETHAKALRDRAVERASEVDTELIENRAAIEEENQQLHNLKGKIEELVQTHGDDDARAQATNTAKSAKEDSERALKATQDAIAALQPDRLPDHRKCLTRSIDGKTSERDRLREQLAGAKASLRLDGNEDPKSARDSAEVRARSAQEYRASVQRRSKAIALLNELFKEEQRSLAEQFTQPLAEKISGYLQCIFGPGARAHVALDNNEFTELRLFRPSSGGATFSFDSLSGGAREQVAAAVRLAMAEVLAADYEGCLPVVFDDAFAYSDPDRVDQLQRMLDLAATRGLQIIVLTCNPADYAALGARSVTLRVERIPKRDAATVAPSEMGSRREGGDDHEQRFISALEAAGGASGNILLRQTLGWDEATYEAVKDMLVADGRVKPGRGRGGSVSLNPDGERSAGES